MALDRLRSSAQQVIDAYQQPVGARLTNVTQCTTCDKRIEAGDVVTANLAPDMAGTWHHTDCADPKLTKPVD